jgi:hypothetical protein
MRPLATALLLALAPLAARAEPDAAPSPAAPQWSLGAGVISFSGSSLVLGSTSAALGTSQATLLFAPQASLERRLGDDTFLLFGVSGTASRQRADLPATAAAQSRADLVQLGLSAGVRRLLTPRGAPMDVSLVLTGDLGFGRSRQDYTLPTGTVSHQTAWRVGAAAGLAVDRELVSGLSLRVATSILGVGYTWRRFEASDSGVSSGTGLTAGLALAPSLELRLAF